MNNEIVHLNIGGKKYDTSRENLMRIPSSSLYSLVHEKWYMDKAQEIFIDRNGDVFQFILDYLREESKLVLPDDQFRLSQIQSEASFYNLAGLQDICETKLQRVKKLQPNLVHLSQKALHLSRNVEEQLKEVKRVLSSIQILFEIIIEEEYEEAYDKYIIKKVHEASETSDNEPDDQDEQLENKLTWKDVYM